MCLIKSHEEIKTADYDIPVYKVLTADNYAPYIECYRYTPGLNSPMEPKPSHLYDRSILESGFLHAYTSELWATNIMEAFEIRGTRRHAALPDRKCFKVVKMYIPKGSGYYEGTDGDICTEWLYWPEEENE